MRVYKEAECEYCKGFKLIAAKGLCRACYQRLRNTGSVEYKRVKNICEVDGCEKYVVTHGLCDKHRQRLARHGHLEQTRPNDWGKREKHPLYDIWKTKQRFNKSQSICPEWRQDFWRFVKDIGDRPSDNYRLMAADENLPIAPDNWYWVEMVSYTTEEQKAYNTAYMKKWKEGKPNYDKERNLNRHYGITLDEYESMQEAQDNKCAICGNEETALNPRTKRPRELAVDHCHNTGKVRSLLCSACNTALGGFKDDIKLLEKAMAYLK